MTFAGDIHPGDLLTIIGWVGAGLVGAAGVVWRICRRQDQTDAKIAENQARTEGRFDTIETLIRERTT